MSIPYRVLAGWIALILLVSPVQPGLAEAIGCEDRSRPEILALSGDEELAYTVRAGELTSFSIATSQGVLVGTVAQDAERQLARIELLLDARRGTILLAPSRVTYDFGRSGIVEASQGSVELIGDCSTLGSSTVYLALMELLLRLEQHGTGDVEVLEDLRLLLQMLYLGTTDCNVPAGVCSNLSLYREPCVDCCTESSGLLQAVIPSVCGASGAAACSPSAVGAVACSVAAALYCYVLLEIAEDSCKLSCMNNPPEQSECAAAGGTCHYDTCPSDMDVNGEAGCGEFYVCCVKKKSS